MKAKRNDFTRMVQAVQKGGSFRQANRLLIEAAATLHA
jgi:hypothetical protein